MLSRDEAMAAVLKITSQAALVIGPLPVGDAAVILLNAAVNLMSKATAVLYKIGPTEEEKWKMVEDILTQFAAGFDGALKQDAPKVRERFRFLVGEANQS